MEPYMEFVVDNWILFAALAAVVLWIVVGEFARLTQGVKPLDATEATRLYNREDAVFVDVRSEADFRKAHLPGAMNVPNGNVEKRNKKLDKKKNKPVIVYCANGATAGKAGKQFKNEGFEQVCQLKGGYAAWEAAGLPVESR